MGAFNSVGNTDRAGSDGVNRIETSRDESADGTRGIEFSQETMVVAPVNTQIVVDRTDGVDEEVGMNQQQQQNEGLILEERGNSINITGVEDGGVGRNTCNCRNRTNCPVGNRCLLDNVVYEAKVRTGSKEYRYVGSSANSFKKRWTVHKHSFRNKGLKNSTSLARIIHDFKERNIEFTLDWKIIKTARAYTGGGAECRLCLEESFEILKRRDGLINKHNELIINCLHRRKMNFNNYKPFITN